MKISTHLENLQNYRKYLLVEDAVHRFMQKKGYLKTEVPAISPSLIPESYLEIFETEFNYMQKKEKLYLTPSPELYLKRLVAYGLGNCYYLGKSFRNSEPNSSWHLPEFTMLEFYKMGVDYLGLADEILELLASIAYKLNKSTSIVFQGESISFDRWEKMTVAEAAFKFAGIPEKILLEEKLFMDFAKKKGYGTKGFKYEDIFSQIFVQEIEPKLGRSGHPTLIYDYPKQLASLAKMNPNGKTAQRCEFYIYGLEVGGFCTELSDYKEQEKRFVLEKNNRKKNHLINHAIDKGFIEALKYGLGDCTGAGIGFERLAMIFTNVDSIKKLKLILFE